MSDGIDEFRDCEGCYCRGIRRAARVITQHYARYLRPMGLRGTQFTLLVALSRSGPMAMNRLAKRLDMDRTTLTRNLRPLAAKGWVAIEQDEDRRVHNLEITAKGRAIARKALPAWREAQRTAPEKLAGLGLSAMLSGRA